MTIKDEKVYGTHETQNYLTVEKDGAGEQDAVIVQDAAVERPTDVIPTSLVSLNRKTGKKLMKQTLTEAVNGFPETTQKSIKFLDTPSNKIVYRKFYANIEHLKIAIFTLISTSIIIPGIMYWGTDSFKQVIGLAIPYFLVIGTVVELVFRFMPKTLKRLSKLFAPKVEQWLAVSHNIPVTRSQAYAIAHTILTGVTLEFGANNGNTYKISKDTSTEEWSITQIHYPASNNSSSPMIIPIIIPR